MKSSLPESTIARTYSNLKEAYLILQPRTKRGLWLLLTAYLVAAVFQTVSVASIGPFLAAALNPRSVLDNPIGKQLADNIGVSTGQDLVAVFGVATVVLIVISQCLTLWLESARLKWSNQCEAELSTGLMDNFMRRRFDYFATRHSSEIHQVVLHEATRVARMVIFPCVVAVTRLIIVLLMIALLAIVDPVVSLVAAGTLGIVYGLMIVILSARLNRLGEKLRKNSVSRYVTAGELLSGIKEIKLRSLEFVSGNIFKTSTFDYASSSARSEFLKLVPKPLIEMLLFAGVILTVSALTLSGQDLTSIIPKASIFLFAGYRIVPNAQMIFQSVSSIRINQSFLESVLEEWRIGPDGEDRDMESGSSERANALSNFTSLSLNSVRYSYPGAKSTALNGVSLSIKRNECVGIVGKSGAGKSTAMDVLLGLLQPQSGFLGIDGKELTPNDVALWRSLVGYVSQSIYLADDTISANIAFGESEIDSKRVMDAAKLASIDDFITSLPDGYNTIVGESGARLSGGQKQRLAIARALYREPTVLFLDEATSALDTDTELSIMNELDQLVGSCTIVIIAHRISTLEICDRIIELDKGLVKKEIPRLELINNRLSEIEA